MWDTTIADNAKGFSNTSGPIVVKGKVIQGLEDLDAGTMVFQAGTALRDGCLITDGGRVLAVVCRGDSIREAIDTVYRETAKVSFEGMHYRRDIGRRALS